MAKNEFDITSLTPEQRDARLALDVERLLRFGRKHKLIKDLDILVARNTLLDLLALAAGSEKLTREEGCQYLTRVGLCAADYIDREVDASLSGGELKRIEIAMIMARGTKLSVFDEPEAGIDLWSFAKLTETFRMLHGTRENTIIVISHQERIIDLADEIVMISGGKVVRHGPKEEIMPHILADTAGMCQFLQPNSKNCRQPKEG